MATIGVINADAEKFRWPGPATLLLTLAMLCLIGSVQYGFHARRHFYSPADAEDWRLAEAITGSALDTDAADALVRSEQRRNIAEWLRLSQRGGLAYNIGIVLLGFGVALVLVAPAGSSPGHAACRWLAAAATAAAAVGELEWTVRTHRVARALARAAQRPSS